MDKIEVSINEPQEQSGSTTSTIDQQNASSIDASAPWSEKPDNLKNIIVEDDESPEDEAQRKKKEKRARIFTFVGLQIALFLAALDG